MSKSRWTIQGEPKEVWAQFHVLWCFKLTFWWRSIPKPMSWGNTLFSGKASQRNLVTSCHMLSCYEYVLSLWGRWIWHLCANQDTLQKKQKARPFFWLIYVLEKTRNCIYIYIIYTAPKFNIYIYIYIDAEKRWFGTCISFQTCEFLGIYIC